MRIDRWHDSVGANPIHAILRISMATVWAASIRCFYLIEVIDAPCAICPRQRFRWLGANRRSASMRSTVRVFVDAGRLCQSACGTVDILLLTRRKCPTR